MTSTNTRELCIMACVFCKDPLFQKWVGQQATPQFDCDEAGAKAFILEACVVESRNEIDTCRDAAELFHVLVRKPFLAWKERQLAREAASC